MSDPEVKRAAEFLATHAVLLLGLGVITVVGSLVAIVVAVGVVARFRHRLLHVFSWLLQRLQDMPVVNRVLTRTSLLIPSAYLGLHLILGLLLATAVTVFVALAQDVVAGREMATFDVAFASALHKRTSPAWEQFFVVVSWLGSQTVITVATLLVAAALFVRDRTLAGLAWIAAQAGGGILNVALKETFDRTRPEFADPMLAASSWSFPSGHAMGTFIFCGLGCYLLLRERRSWITAGVMVALALVWCVVMAFSRLYLGAHFVSDVFAGLVTGGAWVAVCISALEVIRRRERTFARI